MFHEKLKMLRSERNLIQADIANILGITPEAYTQYERGKRQPNFQSLKKLADYFDVSTDYLLGVSEYKNLKDFALTLDNNYTNNEKRLISLYRLLPNELKIEIEGEIKGMLKAKQIDFSSIYRDVSYPLDTGIKDEEVTYMPIFNLPILDYLPKTSDINHTGNALVPIPIKGEAAAGSPIEICEDDKSFLMLDQKYSRYNSFVVRVHGDSMVKADILPGDYAVIRPQPTIENGEIALISVDGSATIKYFYKKSGKYELRSANPSYAPLVYAADAKLHILGKVVDIVKKDSARELMNL